MFKKIKKFFSCWGRNEKKVVPCNFSSRHMPVEDEAALVGVALNEEDPIRNFECRVKKILEKYDGMEREMFFYL